MRVNICIYTNVCIDSIWRNISSPQFYMKHLPSSRFKWRGRSLNWRNRGNEAESPWRLHIWETENQVLPYPVKVSGRPTLLLLFLTSTALIPSSFPLMSWGGVFRSFPSYCKCTSHHGTSYCPLLHSRECISRPVSRQSAQDGSSFWTFFGWCLQMQKSHHFRLQQSFFNMISITGRLISSISDHENSVNVKMFSCHRQFFPI